MIKRFGYFLALVLVLTTAPAHADELDDEESAQPRGLSIEDLAKTGKGFEAIVKAANTERELTTAEKLALGGSAWSLGLADRAKTYWDDALSDRTVKDGERYRVQFMRAVLSLQEGQYAEAATRAEQAINKLPQSPLRAHFRAVHGEAKRLSGDLGGAEKSYALAVSEATGPFKSEARFLLAECQLKSGKMALARQTYTDIEPNSQYTVNAIRRLIQLDNLAENYEAVLNWAQQGLSIAPEEFKDGLTTYYRVTALSRLGKITEAGAVLAEFKARSSDQDLWFSLSEANLVRASLDPVVKEAEEANGR